MTGEIVAGRAWRNLYITISSPIPIRFAINSISCRYVEGRPEIVVVDINLSSNSGFVLSWASINDCFISSYFFYSEFVIGILATTSAGRDDINV